MTEHAVSDVLVHTEDMMLLVIEERWDELLAMQLVQDEMLRALFSVNKTTFSNQEKEDLFEVQRLNQEILKAAEMHKAGLAGELRSMRQGKAKVGAYQSL